MFSKIPRTRREFDEMLKTFIYIIMLIALASWSVGVWCGALLSKVGAMR